MNSMKINAPHGKTFGAPARALRGKDVKAASLAKVLERLRPFKRERGPKPLLLPQQVTGEEARQDREDRLEAQRATLEFDHDYIPGLAVAKIVPIGEQFSASYTTERFSGKLANDLVTNANTVVARAPGDPLDELQDYDDFFQSFPLPAVASVYKTDDSFAEQRLSGPNPVAIRRLEADDVRAGVLNLMDTCDFDVKKEIAAGHVYIADYSGTDPTYRGPSMIVGFDGKYLPKPLAFFRWTGEKFVPVAIQLDVSKDPKVYKPTSARVYTPAEECANDWFFAKICVQCADANHHEMSTHLARCHFTIEPFAISTIRQFEYNHPLSVLLRVHLRFHCANNLLAHNTFFALKEPTLEDLLAGKLSETKALLVEAYDTWDFVGTSFPEDLKERGVNDEGCLPHYPFRDDGKLLWRAIKTFVSAYVKCFYCDDDAVCGDSELQNWAAELADQGNGGKVKGMPSAVTTREELISILTNLIFVCGPMHSAVNFSQMDYIAHVANMPLATYQNIYEMARQKEPISDEQVLQMLPPFKRALQQLTTLATIGIYHFDALGYYDKTLGELYGGKSFKELFQKHPPVIAAMEAFQESLAGIEEIIKERNAERPVPYTYMLPSQVMNSVSI